MKKVIQTLTCLLCLTSFFYLTINSQEGSETEEPYIDITDEYIPQIVLRVAWSPNEKWIAVAEGAERCNQSQNEYSIKIYDTSNNMALVENFTSFCNVLSLSWSYDNRYLAVYTYTLPPMIWDMVNRTTIKQFPTSPLDGVVVFKPNTHTVAVTGHYILVHNLDTDITEQKFELVERFVAWSQDGTRLAVSNRGVLELLNSNTWALQTTIGVNFRILSWSYNDAYIAGIENGQVKVWNLGSNTLSILTTENSKMLHWHPTRNILGVLKEDSIEFWDVPNSILLATRPTSNFVEDFAWSPNGIEIFIPIVGAIPAIEEVPNEVIPPTPTPTPAVTCNTTVASGNNAALIAC